MYTMYISHLRPRKTVDFHAPKPKDITAVAMNVASTVQTGPRFKVREVLSEALLQIEPSEVAVSSSQQGFSPWNRCSRRK